MSDKTTALANAATQGQDQTVAAPIVKAVTAWTMVGITSWADFASFLAALYTLILLGEWIWKKVRPARKKKEAVT